MDSCGTAHRRRFGLVLLAAAAAALVVLVPGALGALNTTDDPGFLTAVACVNGSSVNCNLYASKTDVFLSGSPSNVQVGTFFFAVLDPGSQRDANDGSTGNLSDGVNGAYTTRTFSVAVDGTITNLGSHPFDSANNELQAAPFDDTANNGGVYIMAVCEIDQLSTYDPVTHTYDASSSPVDSHDCKFDAFKVQASCTQDCTPGAGDLFVSKNAIPSFTREFNWSITKSVDACQITLQAPNGCSITSSTKILNYTVAVTKDAGTDSNWQVNGTIDVTNPNDFDVSGVDVTDAVNNGGNCSVTNGTGVTVPANSDVQLGYTCTYSNAPSPAAGNNVATITWPATGSLGAGQADTGNVAFDFGTATPTLIHDSVTLSDVYTTVPSSLPTGFSAVQSGGTAPAGTLSSSGTTTYTYAYTVTVPHDCVELDNTAGFAVTTTDSDLDDSGSAAVKAKVCRTAARTGALTMGYWQNKNGQGIISGQQKSGTCPSGTYLRTFAPFQDLPAGSTCSQVATYVYNVIKAATCSGTTQPCNAMLKAQMLATALDVYFSASGLGNVSIDLTAICKMIDGSGGTATCSGTYEDTSSAFDGSCETVSDLLEDAALQSNSGGSVWYGNAKATQVLAKDTFDAINNQVAFTC